MSTTSDMAAAPLVAGLQASPPQWEGSPVLVPPTPFSAPPGPSRPAGLQAQASSGAELAGCLDSLLNGAAQPAPSASPTLLAAPSTSSGVPPSQSKLLID